MQTEVYALDTVNFNRIKERIHSMHRSWIKKLKYKTIYKLRNENEQRSVYMIIMIRKSIQWYIHY